MTTSNNVSMPNTTMYYPLDLRTDSVEEWVAGLPLANLGETCRLVFTSLTDIGAAELPALQRFKTLELLRDTVHYLTNELKKRFIGSAFPLPEKSRRAAALLCEIQIEMARAYRTTAQQLLAQTILRQDLDTLVAALYRSLFYYGQSWLAMYQTYRQPEPRHWRQIYELYATAERMALHLSPVKSRPKENGVSNISTMFKHILLLNLADPLRLTQQEMAATDLLLDGTASQSELLTSPDINASPAAFVADLERDAAPSRLLYSDAPINESCRLLDTAALIHTLRGLLADAAADTSLVLQIPEPAAKPPRNLLQRLLASWGATGKRGFTRLPYRSRATIKFGLSASHEAVAGPATDRRSALHAADYHCDVLNESAAGACLHWDCKGTPRVRVGELITLRHADTAASDGGIGVVRWMQDSANAGIYFGIQLLVPSATPVTLRFAGEGEADRDYLKGLLLPPLPPHETAHTLLTPAFLYRQGDVVSVRGMREAEQRIKLTRAIESTQAYTRFHFESLGATRQNETQEKKPEPRPDDNKLDSIWSGL